MMTLLLFYAYCVGIVSSRNIGGTIAQAYRRSPSASTSSAQGRRHWAEEVGDGSELRRWSYGAPSARVTSRWPCSSQRR